MALNLTFSAFLLIELDWVLFVQKLIWWAIFRKLDAAQYQFFN